MVEVEVPDDLRLKLEILRWIRASETIFYNKITFEYERQILRSKIIDDQLFYYFCDLYKFDDPYVSQLFAIRFPRGSC